MQSTRKEINTKKRKIKRKMLTQHEFEQLTGPYQSNALKGTAFAETLTYEKINEKEIKIISNQSSSPHLKGFIKAGIKEFEHLVHTSSQKRTRISYSQKEEGIYLKSKRPMAQSEWEHLLLLNYASEKNTEHSPTEILASDNAENAFRLTSTNRLDVNQEVSQSDSDNEGALSIDEAGVEETDEEVMEDKDERMQHAEAVCLDAENPDMLKQHLIFLQDLEAATHIFQLKHSVMFPASQTNSSTTSKKNQMTSDYAVSLGVGRPPQCK